MAELKDTPNILPKEKCWACVYRGEVPGSAHSSCTHPATAEEFSDNNSALAIGILGRHSGITTMPSRAAVTLRITASIYGISRGWFIWPVNFDPTWLETCNGFEPKTQVAASAQPCGCDPGARWICEQHRKPDAHLGAVIEHDLHAGER